jgi:DNA-binding IclR family transcriptional regulator
MPHDPSPGEASPTPAPVQELVDRLSVFSDPTRLRLLMAIHAAPGSSVKALAETTGLNPNTVSQALTALHRAGMVERRKVGRLSCWTLADSAGHALLHHLGAPHSSLHPPH